MPARFCLIFGVIGGATFIAASAILGALLPNYDAIAQTISEIGEQGSPFETIFRAVNLFVAGCLLLFAFGVYGFSKARGVSLIPAGFLAYKGVMAVGVFVFASPHPLHNVFGIAGLPGFLAPLALAVTWPRMRDLPALRAVSTIAGVLLVDSIVVNLVPAFLSLSYIDSHFAFVHTHYGLIQRTLFLFDFWCAYLALVLVQSARQPAHGV
jgi:hypothetical membrane protein